MVATSQLPTNVIRYGRDEPLPERVPLRAGPLSLVFEQGDLRYVRLGDRELLRRVYVAIRDRNWGTVPPRLSDLRIDRGEAQFEISFTSEHIEGDIDFVWRGTISGDEKGTIVYVMDGEARSTFLRNRIGICVLHPPKECAGARFRVLKPDGTLEEGVLPEHISPHQPVLDIHALLHEVLPGLWAEVRFEGDVFEMEDQRNWTDDSFKTYSTPLRLPYPVEVPKGTKVFQSATLTLLGQLPAQAGEVSPLAFTVGDQPAGTLPPIGLGSASHGQPLSAREIERLRALRLAHLRVDLPLAEAGWAEALRRATREAAALGAALEVALLLTDNAEAELRALRAELEAAKPRVARWLVLHLAEHGKGSTSRRWLELARAALGSYDPSAPFGSGPNSNFTELNRVRPPLDVADFVFYPINPQVHAVDNASVMETVQAQRYTVESARAFVDGTPIVVTPVTLKQRFNPVATGPEPEPGPGELPPQVDPRQMALFGAAWTLGSLKYLAESGVASVTYYETSGWRGVMETEAGSPLPERFRSLPGAVFPLYHVFADVGDFAGAEVIPSLSTDRLAVDGLALRSNGATRVLLANLSPDTQRVHVRGLGPRVAVRLLDEMNAEAAMRTPEVFRAASSAARNTSGGELELELLPYAVARIDDVEGGERGESNREPL